MKPSSWIERFSALIPQNSPVLDIASGTGRHSLFLAQKGHGVTSVDIDTSNLPQHPLIIPVEQDLEGEAPWTPQTDYFGGIIVVNYLHRPLFSTLAQALRSDGILLYETFCKGQEKIGRPRNPNFLLNTDELLIRCLNDPKLSVVAYECGLINGSIKQRICAIRKPNTSVAIDAPQDSAQTSSN